LSYSFYEDLAIVVGIKENMARMLYIEKEINGRRST
jgi:hypothetical protein